MAKKDAVKAKNEMEEKIDAKKEKEIMSDKNDKKDNKSFNEKDADTKKDSNGELDEKSEDLNKQDVEELQNKVDELNDKYLRLFSEFDNFRKRTIKEKIEYSKTASSEIITALLPVFDDLARACDAAADNPDNEFLIKGISLIYAKFKSILAQNGVEEIPTVGEVFNTDFHEAISNVEAKDEEEKGRIVDQVEKGYLLHGKVLRYAKVVVAN